LITITEKITGCEDALNQTLNKLNIPYKKDYRHYHNLSQKIKSKDMALIAKHSFSFQQFLQQLQTLKLMMITC